MAEAISERAIGLPAPRLAPFVAQYVGYHLQGFEPGIHAGLPSHFLTFIVSFDAPLELAGMPDPSQRPDRFVALVGGLHAAPALIRHDGNQHGVQLRVTPLGARALFGMPASELASTVLPLETLLGTRAGELVDRLEGARTWTDRFAVLDDVLTKKLIEPRPIRDEVVFGWHRLLTTGGAASVASLAIGVGWSRRYFTAQFRNEFGLTPKAVARVVRFEQARDLLIRSDRPSLARVAADAGYADQAHLAREWRELAGSSPSAWLREEVFPFVQDPDPLEPAC